MMDRSDGCLQRGAICMIQAHEKRISKLFVLDDDDDILLHPFLMMGRSFSGILL